MKEGEHPDKRHSPRFSSTMQLKGWRLAPWVSGSKRRSAIRGQIENIGRGGICVLTERLIPISSLVRCEIGLSRIRVAIPTLMQVRWSQKSASSGRHRIGLQFLL